MKRSSLFWKIYPYFLIIIVVALTVTAYYGTREMRALYSDQLITNLESQAKVMARNVRAVLVSGRKSQLDSECKETAKLSGSRITIIATNGVVMGDSHEVPSNMENHGSRPEIAKALTGIVGVSTRFSSTLQTSMMYVAVPVINEDGVIAVVRASVPVSAVEATLATFYRNIAIGGVIIVILTGLVSMILFRKITGPLRELRDGAVMFADGDFDAKLRIPDVDEIADLSISMNRMATLLDDRIRTIAEQRNEREAILTSMSEGVLAIDIDENIVSLNRVASDLLGLESTQIRGRSLYELVRIPSLLTFVEQASRSSQMIETEITISETSDKHLQVRATKLLDHLDAHVGTVLVFNDITRLKKLESVRRDFVANVSHELKTPITAITGSVETLLDREAISPDDSRRFLEMIARQSERLNNLIEDLLSLARLESQSDNDNIVLARGKLSDIMQDSVTACQEKADQQRVTLNSSCEPHLELKVNRTQLEQAIINLVDNAIKYSDTGSTINVEAIMIGGEIRISVEDTGLGISQEHLPRLFERFYRVDQARSRQAGGTGLGLAIVKHIALAHKGRVGVQSEVGRGSIFTIHLPAQI